MELGFFGFSDVRIRILLVSFRTGLLLDFLGLDLGFSGLGWLEFLWIWIRWTFQDLGFLVVSLRIGSVS